MRQPLLPGVTPDRIYWLDLVPACAGLTGLHPHCPLELIAPVWPESVLVGTYYGRGYLDSDPMGCWVYLAFPTAKGWIINQGLIDLDNDIQLLCYQVLSRQDCIDLPFPSDGSFASHIISWPPSERNNATEILRQFRKPPLPNVALLYEPNYHRDPWYSTDAYLILKHGCKDDKLEEYLHTAFQAGLIDGSRGDLEQIATGRPQIHLVGPNRLRKLREALERVKDWTKAWPAEDDGEPTQGL